MTNDNDDDALEFVGFWPRVGAALIDTVLALLVIAPLLYLVYGNAYFSNAVAPLFYFVDGGTDLSQIQPANPGGLADTLISYVLPAAAVVAFWLLRQATPGKMVIGARVVDATTGAPLSTGQAIGRYLAYFISTVPFCLGLIWVAFDPRKQGWHDKLANTVVVRHRVRSPQPVAFTPR